MSSTDKIQNEVRLLARVPRVWPALADACEFGGRFESDFAPAQAKNVRTRVERA